MIVLVFVDTCSSRGYGKRLTLFPVGAWKLTYSRFADCFPNDILANWQLFLAWFFATNIPTAALSAGPVTFTFMGKASRSFIS
jgi:hypothetical protein